MADTEYTREQALEVATLFRSFTKSSHRWHDGRPLHLVAADMLDHLAAIPAASLREQEIASFQLLQWTTDDAGRGIALVNGRTYSHAQVCRLRDELAEVAKIGSGAAPSSEGDEGSPTSPPNGKTAGVEVPRG